MFSSAEVDGARGGGLSSSTSLFSNHEFAKERTAEELLESEKLQSRTYFHQPIKRDIDSYDYHDLGVHSSTNYTPIADDVLDSSESELEAIRASVRRLREQREAVEKLKEFASKRDRKAAQLERELVAVKQERDALQQSKEKQWQLELAVSTLKEKLADQERVSEERTRALRRLEEEKRMLVLRCEADRSRMEKAATEHAKEMQYMKTLVKEAREALSATRNEYRERVGVEANAIDRIKQEKEALLFQRGELEGRVQELASSNQRLKVALGDREGSCGELSARLSSLSRDKTSLQEEVASLKQALAKAKASDDDGGEAARLTRRLRDENSSLSQTLSEVRLELEAARKLCISRETQVERLQSNIAAAQVTASTASAEKDRAVSALAEEKRIVMSLRRKLEEERRERTKWAKDRTELLSQFCSEENKIHSILEEAGASRSTDMHDEDASAGAGPS